MFDRISFDSIQVFLFFTWSRWSYEYLHSNEPLSK